MFWKSVEVEFGVFGEVEEENFRENMMALVTSEQLKTPKFFASIQEHIKQMFDIGSSREAILCAKNRTSSRCVNEIYSQQEVSLLQEHTQIGGYH